MGFDASQRRLLTGANDGTVKMWNCNNGKVRKKSRDYPLKERGMGCFARKNDSWCAFVCLACSTPRAKRLLVASPAHLRFATFFPPRRARRLASLPTRLNHTPFSRRWPVWYALVRKGTAFAAIRSGCAEERREEARGKREKRGVWACVVQGRKGIGKRETCGQYHVCVRVWR